MLPWRVTDLGTLGYREARDRQLALVDTRKTGAGEDTLLLVEHPHVITLGRGRAAAANVVAPGDVEVVEIERGGDVTYHGPGQLVAYPIVLLGDGERDLHRCLRGREEAVRRPLARFELPAGRAAGKTGVWIADRKICSMGIACRRWVTFHGLALNVTTDLDQFFRINPCGFDPTIMTSIAAERAPAAAPPMTQVKAVLAAELGLVLGRTAQPSDTVTA
jgi:lipoate-protein ligase B